jgi:hypothetical protein
MKEFQSSDGKTKQVGIATKLLKQFGTMESVLESQDVFSKLRELSEKELQACMKQILADPQGTPEWASKIATLIGEARVHNRYVELFTIKEKTKS